MKPHNVAPQAKHNFYNIISQLVWVKAYCDVIHQMCTFSSFMPHFTSKSWFLSFRSNQVMVTHPSGAIIWWRSTKFLLSQNTMNISYRHHESWCTSGLLHRKFQNLFCLRFDGKLLHVSSVDLRLLFKLRWIFIAKNVVKLNLARSCIKINRSFKLAINFPSKYSNENPNPQFHQFHYKCDVMQHKLIKIHWKIHKIENHSWSALIWHM